MRMRTAKRICLAVHYGHGDRLNWKPDTLARMEAHRRKWNKRHSAARRQARRRG